MEAFEEVATEDFLRTGICLGNKRCKKRRSARRDRRKERRSLRMERKRARTESKKADAEYKKQQNLVLAGLNNPQQHQAQSYTLHKQATQQTQVQPQNPQNNPQQPNHTGLYIGGGIGLLVIIGLVLFIVLKK